MGAIKNVKVEDAAVLAPRVVVKRRTFPGKMAPYTVIFVEGCGALRLVYIS